MLHGYYILFGKIKGFVLDLTRFSTLSSTSSAKNRKIATWIELARVSIVYERFGAFMT